MGRGKLLGRSSPLPKPIPLKNFPTTLRPMMEWDLKEMGRPWKKDPFPRRKGSLSQTHSLPKPFPPLSIQCWNKILKGEDLGKGQTSWKKFTPSQTHPPQELSHRAPSNLQYQICNHCGRSAVGNLFYGGYGFVLWLTCFCFCEKSYLGGTTDNTEV